MLLLTCLKSYAQKIPYMTEVSDKDSILVQVPLKYIKLANQKLVERELLMHENEYKDSIISDYELYVEEQDKIIKDFQERIDKCNKLNSDINKRLEQQKKTSIICGSVAAASIITIVLTALIN